jgi:hypothetical protein
MEHVFAGGFFPPGPRAFHADCDQTLTRRFDVAATDGQAAPPGGGVVHAGLVVLQVGDGFVHEATRPDDQLRFPRGPQFVQEFGDTAGAIE